MSGIKGYPSQKKLLKPLPPYETRNTDAQMEFITAQQTSSDKVLQDSAINGLYRLNLTPSTLEAGAVYPKRELKITGHGARKGDVVRFEQGSSNPGFEVGIQYVPDADTIILAAELHANSVIGDEVYLLRYVTARYGDDGSINVSVTQTPVEAADFAYYNAADSGAITAAAYTEIISALPQAIREIEIDNTTGKTLYLAIGGAGSEVDQLIIPTKGLSRQACAFPSGARFSVKSAKGTATFGEVNINCFA